MPGTGDTSLNNFSFPERPVLVLAYIGDCGNLSVVPEDGDSLPSARHYTRTLLCNLLDCTNRNVSAGLRTARQVVPPLHSSTHDVQRCHDGKSDAQKPGQERTGLGL